MKDKTAGIRDTFELVALLLILFGATAVAFAQAVSGTVVGTVRDASGAVVPSATVTATNQQTGIAQSTVTGGEGSYTLPNLPPGTYRIAAQSKGFTTAVVESSGVQVQQTTRVDFTLSPGETTQQINVTAEAPAGTEHHFRPRPRSGIAPDAGVAAQWPAFEQLVTIVPGAVQAGWSDFAENPSAAGSVTPTQAVVNGLPWSGNYYMVDGVHNTEPLNAFISITPPLDSIDSFKVETSNPNAEYGSFGGAIVNLVIKSGTNGFHGGAFDFLRNDALNARDFLAQTKSPYKSNQFGGTFGGPIVKNKLFFFVDFQQLLQHQGQTNVLTVPPILQRQGVLTEGGQSPIYDPLNGQPFANQTIPTARIDPVTQKVANLYPQPTSPGLVITTSTTRSMSSTCPRETPRSIGR